MYPNQVISSTPKKPQKPKPLILILFSVIRPPVGILNIMISVIRRLHGWKPPKPTFFSCVISRDDRRRVICHPVFPLQHGPDANRHTRRYIVRLEGLESILLVHLWFALKLSQPEPGPQRSLRRRLRRRNGWRRERTLWTQSCCTAQKFVPSRDNGLNLLEI